MLSINASVSLIETSFSFLNEYGYTRSIENDVAKFDKYTIVMYQSDVYQKRIEMVMNNVGDYISFTIRRKLADWAPYNDKLNNLIASNLALIAEGIECNYDHYSFNMVGREAVIENVAALFLKFKSVFCSDKWFDVDRLQKLTIEYYKVKFNVDLSARDKEDKLSDLFKAGLKFISDANYKITEDSELLPIYKSVPWFITYSDGINTIKIEQYDWRDFPNTYILIINKEKIADFDYPDYPSAAAMISHIKYIISENV